MLLTGRSWRACDSDRRQDPLRMDDVLVGQALDALFVNELFDRNLALVVHIPQGLKQRREIEGTHA